MQLLQDVISAFGHEVGILSIHFLGHQTNGMEHLFALKTYIYGENCFECIISAHQQTQSYSQAM